MKKAASVALSIAAITLLVTAVALYLVGPRSESQGGRQQQSDLTSSVDRAATYYEFGHFNRAADTYQLAAERGMHRGADWVRYAHAHQIAYGLDLGLYIIAYTKLLEQSPNHDSIAEIEALLQEHATGFIYEDARGERYAEGALLELTGTISRVIWGRVATGTDTYVVSTRDHRWIGHVGDEVLIAIPREHRYRSGDTLVVLGTYDGLCRRPDERDPTRTYPCIAAVSSRLARAP